MKTVVSSELADYIWLTSQEACRMLADLADDTTPLHLKVSRLRRDFSAVRTHLLLEQVELRRRAAAKFAQPDQMFFTPIGLEQATDEWIAGYKASRLTQALAASHATSPGFAADLCCGIGGDLIAISKHAGTVGVDLDPIAAHFASVNSNATVTIENVQDWDRSNTQFLHIDPDRRAAGQRTTSVEFFEPDLSTIDQLLKRVPNAAVKLAPATTPPEHWSRECELEWISRDRECRQLVAWHGILARSPGLHRATVVAARDSKVMRTLIGEPKLPSPMAERIESYVFDFDAAVLAAKLKGALAAELQLAALSGGPTYFTGAHPIQDAAVACFEVVDVLPLETRKLSRHLAERGIGSLEIKKRGVEIEPEKLRRELKLRGDHTATLLLTRTAGRGVAILAERVKF